MDPFRGRRDFVPDHLYFQYPKINSKDSGLFTIEVSDQMLGQVKIFKINSEIDLFGFETNLPPDGIINTINELIDPTFFNKIPIELFSCGYVSYKMNNALFFNPITTHGHYENDFIEYETILKKTAPPGKNDTIEKFIAKCKDWYYFISVMSQQGQSGSPVFGKFIYYKNGKKLTTYKFYGVLFGRNYDLNKAWAIKGKTANNYFLQVFK